MRVDILKRCIDLVRTWWRVDRVRVSPQEGRLLRLQPSCVLLLNGRRIIVETRCLERQNARLWIVYDCRNEAGSGQLRVAAGEIVWCEKDTPLPMADADIVVLGGYR